MPLQNHTYSSQISQIDNIRVVFLVFFLFSILFPYFYSSSIVFVSVKKTFSKTKTCQLRVKKDLNWVQNTRLDHYNVLSSVTIYYKPYRVTWPRRKRSFDYFHRQWKTNYLLSNTRFILFSTNYISIIGIISTSLNNKKQNTRFTESLA